MLRFSVSEFNFYFSGHKIDASQLQQFHKRSFCYCNSWHALENTKSYSEIVVCWTCAHMYVAVCVCVCISKSWTLLALISCSVFRSCARLSIFPQHWSSICFYLFAVCFCFCILSHHKCNTRTQALAEVHKETFVIFFYILLLGLEYNTQLHYTAWRFCCNLNCQYIGVICFHLIYIHMHVYRLVLWPQLLWNISINCDNGLISRISWKITNWIQHFF